MITSVIGDRHRPYQVEYAGSRPITEAKQRWARSVLGRETAWEHRVLMAFCTFLYLFFLVFKRLRIFSSQSSYDILSTYCRHRPYHVEYAGSRPITEAKQRWARSVLGRETAWEHRVLMAFCTFFVHNFFLFKRLRIFSSQSSYDISSIYCRHRPYHVEYAGSRPITEAKQRWARSVLGRETAWEHRVLMAFCTFLYLIFFVFRRLRIFSSQSSYDILSIATCRAEGNEDNFVVNAELT